MAAEDRTTPDERPDGAAADRPGVAAARLAVEIPVDGARPADAIAALDATLGGDLGELTVALVASAGEQGREALAALCADDPRAEVVAEAPEPPAGAIRVVIPPRARPSAGTLAALRELLDGEGAGAVEVAVPGRVGLLARFALPARLPWATRVRATRAGTEGRALRVSAARIGLGGSRSPFRGPPPRAAMARERAEHLRHRARSATVRADFDRGAQRLLRETMRADHERARARLIEARIGRSGPLRWIAWRLTLAGRAIFEGARRVWWAIRGARALARRAWRFARDQLRRRRSPKPS